MERERVIVENRSDGGILFWLARLYVFSAFIVLAVIYAYVFSVARYFAREAPQHDLEGWVETTAPPSRIYTADGTLLGEFADQWRQIVPYDQIPEKLKQAVVAVEDHNFFEHKGIYFRGIFRAAWANLTAGDFAQGGSTIEQQLAKQFLGADKTLTRKGKEAVMARRFAARYSKQAILSTYLNQIYLGAGAWGVAAAAQRYFQKSLDQLTLAEMALIAGLPKAPSAYSPIRNPERALERRNLVLDQMRERGYISAAEAEAAKAEKLSLSVFRDVFPNRHPYYAEYARRYISESKDPRYAGRTLSSGGLIVETAVDPSFDAAAYSAADYGARKQDKRQGWRGPEWTLDGKARDTFLARQRELYGNGDLALGRRYLALVEKVRGNGADLRIGDRLLTLPLANMAWASPWQAGNAPNDQVIDAATRALHVGDVVWVSRETRRRGKFVDWHIPDLHNPAWRPPSDDATWDDAHPDTVVLEQVPHPQTAIFAGDHRTGYVVAMVGGSDFSRSEFNRAVQACRQPGSTYKPIYYSLALDTGYGFDTKLNDKPVTLIDPITGAAWTPTNLNNTVDHDVTLEYALVFSKNIPSVDIFKRVGANNVEAWARKLGFTTKIFPDDALALGASCTLLHEMTHAFAIFARGGKSLDWVFVRRVLDRDGSILEDHTVPFDPQLPPGDRIDRVAATAGVEPEQVISARTAYLTTKLLAQMVKFGFTKTLRNTGIHAAGKTGTSSDTHDTSFVAFTSRHATSVWMGDDKKQRALGKDDAAFMTVVPLWARTMAEATAGYPNLDVPWQVPPGVKASDRGDHKKGEAMPPMDLIYRHDETPTTATPTAPPR